jgi:hypothetical protein
MVVYLSVKNLKGRNKKTRIMRMVQPVMGIIILVALKTMTMEVVLFPITTVILVIPEIIL